MNGHALLSDAPVKRAVAHLAIPSVLSAILSIAYNLTDTYFVALLRDTAQLAAVSISMPAMMLLSAAVGLISSGAPSLISLLAGAGRTEDAARVRSFCVYGSLSIGLVATPLALLFIRPFLSLLGARDDVLFYAARYAGIVAAFSAAGGAQGAMQGVLKADGRAAEAGIGSALGILANAALDPLFIFGFKMGVSGAALATGLGGLISLCWFAARLRGTIPLRAINPGKTLARRSIALGLSGTLSNVLTALTVGVSLLLAADYGDALIAAVSVASKVYAISITLAAALAFSLQPFVGYNFAAEKRARMRRGIALSLGVGTAVCLSSAVAYLSFGDAFMRAFSDDPAIIRSGARMMRFFAIGVPFASLEMTAIMYLSATGQAGRSIVAGLGRQLVLFFPALFLLRALLGLDGLMLAYPATDVAAAALGMGLCFLRAPGGAQLKRPPRGGLPVIERT